MDYSNDTFKKQREELLKRRSNFDTTINVPIDAYSRNENERLVNSNRNLDDLLLSGSNIMSSLREQRNTLHNVQKQISNLLSTLGLSNTVMNLIEKRAFGDKIILFGGMIIFILFIIFFMIYFW